jgi:hypothetical protein
MCPSYHFSSSRKEITRTLTVLTIKSVETRVGYPTVVRRAGSCSHLEQCQAAVSEDRK